MTTASPSMRIGLVQPKALIEAAIWRSYCFECVRGLPAYGFKVEIGTFETFRSRMRMDVDEPSAGVRAGDPAPLRQFDKVGLRIFASVFELRICLLIRPACARANTACGWRIRNYAAIGIWNRPRQWCRQA